MTIEKREENITEELFTLYRGYGYQRYKPGRFEEYALYRDNKDFLINKNVITFTDLNGKLMAMRPDITLSLIKHCASLQGQTQKYFYNENVYRPSAGGKNFKEIAQTGVEFAGNISLTDVAELTFIICKTLSAISADYALDISHMAFTEGLFESYAADGQPLTEYLQTKNFHDFIKLAQEKGYSEKFIKAFEFALNFRGNAREYISEAKSICLNGKMLTAVNEIAQLLEIAEKCGFGDKINIDFSATANADYYNGFIYNGYINGIPHRVLSGGRYDKLLQKLGKSGGAIGFALYLGEIERYLIKDERPIDCVIVSDGKDVASALMRAQKVAESGKVVYVSNGNANKP